ncbi:MAG: TetR/AcrR family transcriptional regulator [Bacteroidaceae bacterium]|nr:TetR/AcrR family transcriptional regulator [Bacteroidaceae bacterium]
MKENNKQGKEQEILAAAEQEFLSKGYEGARTTSIAKAAGVTHAMLHYYFRTKESLFERIVDEKFRLMLQSMLAVIGDPSLPVVERLKSGISAHFDFVAQNSKLPLFVINEVLSRPERYAMLQNKMKNLATDLFSGLQQDIDNAAERGEIVHIDVRMLLMSIVSLNIFAIVTFPFMRPLIGELGEERERFLSQRKAENIETILHRIKR